MFPRSHYGFILRHSLFGRDPDAGAGSVIVFGPDGQASVVAPQDAGNDPSNGAQGGAPAVIQSPAGQTGDLAPQQVGGAIPVNAPPVSSEPAAPTLAVTPPAPGVISTAAESATAPTTSLPPATSPAVPSDAVSTASVPSASQETPMPSSQLSSASASSTVVTPASSSPPTTMPISTAAHSAETGTASVSATPSASSSNNSGLYIGIALACIVGLLLVAALIASFLHVRSIRRKRQLQADSIYSWRDQPHKESYLGSGKSPDMQDEEYYGGYAPNLQRPPDVHINGSAYSDDIIESYSSGNSPVQQSVLSPPGLNGRVPLQVANMMPGDAYPSSDEASRPTTSLGILHTPLGDDYGTPREERPRFLGVQDGGLGLPWAYPKHVDDLEGGYPGKDEAADWEHLPFPGEIPRFDAVQQQDQAKGRPAETNVEAWTASLRANLANVLSMAGGYLTSNASAPPPEDRFTSMPSRSKRSSVRSSRTGRGLHGATLAREDTNRSRMSQLYTLEEVEEGSGIVHVHGADNTPPLNITKKPSSVVVKSRQRAQLCVPPSGTVTRASSVYSTASATSSVADVGSKAPRLPSIAPLSRDISMRHGGFSGDLDASASLDNPFRGESRGQARPKILTRLTSNDEEKMVQKALRERRKKVMSMGLGRGRAVSSRASSTRTNGSRRSRGRGSRH
ncbi:hypothetical protein OE88DRAFT_1664544 [Heliocybe sulcata]|uniref:Uncharacterized protein n=1 Tax=Heliocybe sulcata TaxID=5364 RepID=A0A5C3N314_9AGAM|nr:hypothetical protein OE88DRAFT_1664544 [Heliocybe sulcata]